MIFYLVLTGVLTLLLGFVHGPAAGPVLVFPPGRIPSSRSSRLAFTILSLHSPTRSGGLAVSLVILIGFLLGGGIVPSAMGYWAEIVLFLFGVCSGGNGIPRPCARLPEERCPLEYLPIIRHPSGDFVP